MASVRSSVPAPGSSGGAKLSAGDRGRLLEALKRPGDVLENDAGRVRQRKLQVHLHHVSDVRRHRPPTGLAPTSLESSRSAHRRRGRRSRRLRCTPRFRPFCTSPAPCSASFTYV